MVFTCFLIDEPPNFLKESAGRKKNRPASVLLCQSGGITEPTNKATAVERLAEFPYAIPYSEDAPLVAVR